MLHVCVYNIYIYIYIHVYIYIYICTYLYIYIYIYMYLYLYLYLYLSIYIFIYIHEIIYIYIYIPIHIHMSVPLLVHFRTRPSAATPPRICRRRENMVRANMVLAEFIKFKHGLYRSCGIECFEGIMLEPCLLQPCFHVAGYGRAQRRMMRLLDSLVHFRTYLS